MNFIQMFNSAILFVLMIKQQLFSISAIWIVLLALQTIWLVLISIQSISKQMEADSPNIISNFLLKIYAQINNHNLGLYIIICQSVCSFGMITSFGIFLWRKKRKEYVDKNLSRLSNLIWLNCLFAVVIQATLFTGFLYVRTLILANIKGQKYSVEVYSIFLIVVALFGITFVGILNFRVRMMGNLYFLFLLLLNLTDQTNIIASIVGMLICFYHIKTDQQNQFQYILGFNIRKILHLTLVSSFVWKFIEQFQYSQSNHMISHPLLSYIYLLVHIVFGFTIGLAVYRNNIDNSHPPPIVLCRCLQNIRASEDSMESKVRAYEIEEEFFRQNDLKKEIEEEKFERIPVNIQWDASAWQKFAYQMMATQYKKQETLESGIEIIKCMLNVKDKSLFKVLQFLQQLVVKYQKKKLRFSYELTKLILIIQKAFFPQSEELTVTQIMKQIDALTQRFYRLCSDQVAYIYQFWGKVICDRLSLEQCEEVEDIMASFGKRENTGEMITKIRYGLQQIQSVVDQICKVSYAGKERNIYNIVRRLSLSSHDEDELQLNGAATQQKPKRNEKQKSQETFSSYFEIVNSKIVNISVKLAMELGYKKIEVIGEQLSFLIPSQYQIQIEELINSNSQPVMVLDHYVPLKCANDSVVLKQLRVYLQTDCEHGYRIVFHLFSSFQNEHPFVVYNTLTNNIEFYNNSFIESYSLSRLKIKTKINNNCLCSDQVFLGIDLTDKSTKSKLEEGMNQMEQNCFLKTYMFGEKTSQRIQKVRINLIQNQRSIMILRILKGHKKKKFKSDIMQLEDKLIDSENSLMNSCQNLSNNKNDEISKPNYGQMTEKMDLVYCPIQHPYKAKIFNKKCQLLKNYQIGLHKIASILVLISIVILISESVLYLDRTENLRSIIKTSSETTISKFQFYRSLLHGYQSFFQIQIIKKEKDNLQKKGISIMVVLLLLQSQLTRQIDAFHVKYLSYLQLGGQKVVNYKIKFNQFQIQTDTTKTNLFDFENNILQYDLISTQNQRPLKFLLQNLENIVKLIEAEAQSDPFIQKLLEKQLFLFYVYKGVTFVVICSLMIVSFILRLRIIGVKRSMEKIFQNADYNSLVTMFEHIKETAKCQISEISEEAITQSQKYSRLMELAMSFRNKQNKRKKCTKNPGEQSAHLLNVSNSTRQMEQKPKLISESHVKQLGYGIYLAIVVVSIFVFFVQLTYMERMAGQETKVVDFQLENKRICQNTIMHILQTQFQILTGRNTHDKNKITALNQKKLPSFFQQFQKFYFIKTQTNLCQSIKNKSKISYPGFDCLKIGNGILQYGMAKSLENLHNVLNYSQSTQQWVRFHSFSSLLISQEVFYTQNVVLLINLEVLQQLALYQKKYRLQEKSIVELITMLTILLYCCIAGINIYLRRFIARVSQVSKSAFLILPTSVLLQPNILQYLRDKDILQKISRL